MSAGYAPLWCKSNFSFLEGASHPEELVETAAELGLSALALTDRDGVYGVVRAHLKARELGVRLILGSEIHFDDGSPLVLLAESRRGYGHLCRMISSGRLRCPKGECRVRLEEVCEKAEGLIALWGGAASALAGEVEPASTLGALREAFGERLMVLVARHREEADSVIEARLRRRAERWGLPLVAATEVLYHSPGRQGLQDVLACLRAGVRLAEAGRVIRPNAEHALKSPHAFGRLYADLPEAVERTLEIAGRCRFSLDAIRYRYPSERLPDGTTSAQWLRRLTFEGARWRYGDAVPEAVRSQLEKELAVIEELDYPGYFLTMYEIVRFCREQQILCQGRGSAANSAVCYCLGITAVDPVRSGLLFERFLSRERAEPPDIDLDIAHQRREEVIQHVYAKYGREYAAMVAVVIRYRPRSAVRDVGKVLGLSATALDRLARLLPHYGEVEEAVLRQAGLDPEASPAAGLLLRLANEVLDFPRHLSIHPGGFLLGERPVCELVPVENGAMEDRTVIQWDKDDVEALGLFKVDLLGLGALTQLDMAFHLIERHRGEKLSMATIPPDDPETYAAIRRADTVGVFQIESRAQMAMLPRLRPECFYDLVVEISIVRPGPISGGMVHPYLRRRSGEEEVQYPHPSLRPVLEKTLGVPLFQEQVMRLAVVAADYTPGEADQLRRDMAAWRRTGRIEKHHQRLVSRMVAKGIAPEFAERVFEQIRGFGEYGFPESHAASFALICYAAAYLKRHYAPEFTCALLGAQPMGFYSVATLVEDARHHGVEVRPIDATRSYWECTLEPAGEGEHPLALRMGARWVKGLRRQSWERLEAAREQAPFASYEDCVRRSGMAEADLLRLAEAGAFEALGQGRRQALWEGRRLVRRREQALPLPVEDEAQRFAPLDLFDTVSWDYRRTSHSPRAHPVETVREQLAAQGLPTAEQVRRMRDGRRVRYAGAVICRQRPGTAGGVTFLTLEDETGFVNVVIWKDVWKRYALLVKTHPLLGLTGKVQSEQGVVHVVAESFWAPRLERQPARSRSHDFH
ncbi:MAG TPA: DNA polymerase III subunit alpha [Acidobacteria bacterium]|nr:DNA polymerase III subunit alpha [Acidobacteriota bacterium]